MICTVDLEIENWFCAETWALREMLEDLDIRLAQERLRLIDLKYKTSPTHRGAFP